MKRIVCTSLGIAAVVVLLGKTIQAEDPRRLPPTLAYSDVTTGSNPFADDAASSPASGAPSAVQSAHPAGQFIAVPSCGNGCEVGCGTLAGNHCSSCLPGAPWTLPQPCILEEHGIRLGGWVEAGVSVAASNPSDRYNGVVTFNDRDGEAQVNQLWLFLERPADASGGDWDLGGRIDFVYGTDGRFTQAADGLEASWDQTARFYQVAVPQFYVDVACGDWLLRAGHFFTIIGYEVVPAIANFFYSHSYTMQYGEPFTHTGFLLSRSLGPNWKIFAGLHRGNDQFDDTDGLNALNFLGGLTWIADDQWATATFAISSTEQGPGVKQQIYSIVSTVRVSESLKYVLQNDYGQTYDANAYGKTEWYGINQYFLYTINPCWTAGLRVEWFRDEGGTRVRGLGDGNLNQGPWNQFVGPDGRVKGFYAGDFWEITAGLNWKPRANLVVRPEVRWDWFDSRGLASNGPYDAGDRKSQFLLGCDAVVTF